MNQCPISQDMIDERVARANGLFVFGLMSFYLVTPYRWVAVLLAADFLIKGFIGGPRRSPVSLALKGLFRLLPGRPHPTNAGPKQFAAKIGFVLSTVASACWMVGLVTESPDVEIAGFVTAGMIVVCALLEGALGFCLGCWIYGLLPKRIQRVAALATR